MAGRAKTPTTRTGKQASSKGEGIRRVDPMTNRPPNADEASPETLVPDIVRTNLTTDHGEHATEREARIAQRAYELAQARGFSPGAELDDWLQAEREIDAQSVKQVAPEDQFTG